MRPVTIGARAARTLLALVVGFLLTVPGRVVSAAPAAAQTRVGAQPVEMILTVGAQGAAGQELIGVRGPPQSGQVSATGVAPNPGMYRSSVPIEGTGGPALAPSMDVVNDVAGRAGIGLDGVKVSINTDADLLGRGLYGHTPDAGNITLYPDAFANEETLAATLGHERNHIFQAGLYGMPGDTATLNAFEHASFAVEQSYLDYFRTFGGVR